MYGGLTSYKEEYDDPLLQQIAEEYQQSTYGYSIFRNGIAVPLGANFVQETTVFREFGPLAGNTIRLGYETSPMADLRYQTVDFDARYYWRLAGTGLAAFRFKGYSSWGDTPNFFYFGGNSEMRGYDYQSFVGNQGWFANAELRFPLVQAMATPIGILGGIRGAFYFNIGGAWYKDQPFEFWSNDPYVYRPIVDYTFDPVTEFFVPVYGPTQEITGFRLQDGRASYGLSLETFALGFPIHFDWSWKTLFNKQWEDAVFSYYGGSEWFRQSEFAVWIGYDF
jgi:outer membrane protein assembly factor BamA